MTYGKMSDAEKALIAVSKDKKIETALLSCATCGATTVELTWLDFSTKGLESSERTAYNTLNRLAGSSGGFPPLLVKSTETIAGQPGGPKKVYRLTKFGLEILNKISPELTMRYLDEPTDIALRHRYCQLEVYVLARKQGWDAEIEKVLPYRDARGTDRSLRCDVVLQTTNGPLYVEIEQKLNRTTLPRAQKKLEHWHEYSVATGELPHLMLFFNLDLRSRDKTMEMWMEALWKVNKGGEIQFPISYLLMSNLRGTESLQEDLETSTMTLAPRAPIKKGNVHSTSWQPHPIIAPLLEGMEDILADQMAIKRELRDEDYLGKEDMSEPGANVAMLMRAAKYIYDASGDSKTWKEKFKDPVRSLLLLRYYLTREPNLEMYAALQEAFKQAANKGVTLQKIQMSAAIQNVFLSHFYIGRDNQLNVWFIVPNFEDKKGGYKVQVNFDQYDGFMGAHGLTADHLSALEWMLSSLFIYPDFLGLTKDLLPGSVTEEQDD
ncbi:MAG: hypothetical protein QY332_10145 [Anaerolineales bacterium]|nr:MAG: hypothetical protein QY332_10145 [Anaerolineales bacterium]